MLSRMSNTSLGVASYFGAPAPFVLAPFASPAPPFARASQQQHLPHRAPPAGARWRSGARKGLSRGAAKSRPLRLRATSRRAIVRRQQQQAQAARCHCQPPSPTSQQAASSRRPRYLPTRRRRGAPRTPTQSARVSRSSARRFLWYKRSSAVSSPHLQALLPCPPARAF
jgi:hypothetical protein